MGLATLPKGAGTIIQEAVIAPTPDAFRTDKIIAILNQTAFNLFLPTIDSSNIIFSVNGVIYNQGVDYTFAPSTCTWLNILFNMSAGDLIQIYYRIS